MKIMMKTAYVAALLIAAPAAYAETAAPAVPTPLAGGSVDYWSSFWSTSADSVHTDSSSRIGNVDADSTFETGSVVSSANLASNVSGVQVHVGSAEGNSTASNGLTLGTSAFQSFAGVQALNMNTGAAASQNAVVNLNTTGK